MRVDYTLPALQPGTVLEADSIGSDTTPSFREQLRGATAHLPVSWEQQLNLDARPVTARFIGPPPRPQTLELNDAETERARWRRMVVRHSRSMETLSSPVTTTSKQSVQAMLQMLVEIQRLEDAIVYRNAALTRG